MTNDNGINDIGTNTFSTAQEMIDDLNRKVLVDVDKLLDHEWSNHGNCPVCGDVGPAETDHPNTTYHLDTCWLGNVIKSCRQVKEK